MNLDHVKAMAHGENNRSAVHNGVALWTEGRIMIPTSVEGAKETPSMAKMWGDVSAREGEVLMELGTLYRFGLRVCRELNGDGLTVFLDEAYRRTIQDDHGIRIYAVSEAKAIAFRRNGNLLGIAMPFKVGEIDASMVVEGEMSDEKVFSHLAREENDWYLQGPEELRRRLREALAE